MPVDPQGHDEFLTQAHANCDELTQALLRLIAEEAGRSALPHLASLAEWMAGGAEEIGLAGAARLGRAIESCLRLMHQGQVDPAQALPLLASGVDLLAKSFDSTPLDAAGKARAQAQTTSLVAACYELETLLPIDGGEPRNKSGPDVPVARLRRRRDTVLPDDDG